jgi:hypothetical protein
MRTPGSKYRETPDRDQSVLSTPSGNRGPPGYPHGLVKSHAIYGRKT